MTPLSRAEQIVPVMAEYRRQIAAAVELAVLAEREACAKLVESMEDTYDDSEDRYLSFGWCEATAAAAAAIRARSKP